MCDIVSLKCRGCGVEIDTHIGDFSVGRGNVYPFCPRDECRQKALRMLLGRFISRPPENCEDAETQKALGIDKESAEDGSHGRGYIVFNSIPRAYDDPDGENSFDIKEVCANAEPGKAFLFLIDWPREVGVNG